MTKTICNGRLSEPWTLKQTVDNFAQRTIYLNSPKPPRRICSYCNNALIPMANAQKNKKHTEIHAYTDNFPERQIRLGE